MDHRVKIITPESVQLSFETAGIGSRFIALLLDTLIQVGIVLIALFGMMAAGISFEGIFTSAFSWYTAVLIIVLFMTFVGYFFFFEMIFRGQTPGKKVMKIRVIKSNGQPLTFTGSILRNIFRLADMFPGFYGIGIIVMFISPQSKRIGDYVGGTIVVKEYTHKVPFNIGHAAKEAEQTVNMYPLSDEEYRLIKSFLERKDQLLPEKRMQLAYKLSKRFFDKFFIPQEERKDGEAFLAKLLRMNE